MHNHPADEACVSECVEPRRPVTPTAPPHPSVVAAQIALPSCRIIQIHAPNADSMSAIQFAQSVARVLEDGNTPVVVMREGWEIVFTDLEE